MWLKSDLTFFYSWQDLNKLNEFFMNREEDIVIRLQDLEDRSSSISTPEEQQHLKSAFVKLHGEYVSSGIAWLLAAFLGANAAVACTGEMVLLLHWSLLNFAAVVKILKKHGGLIGVCAVLL